MRFIDSICCNGDWTKITPAHNATHSSLGISDTNSSTVHWEFQTQTQARFIGKFTHNLKHALNNLKKQTQQVFLFINGIYIACNLQGLLLLQQLKLETTNNN